MMDFATLVGWKAIVQSILSYLIDGDLLKLVHLVNGFRIVGGQNPLQVDDVCTAETRVMAFINNVSGKVVKAKGNVARNGKAVIEVVHRSITVIDF